MQYYQLSDRGRCFDIPVGALSINFTEITEGISSSCRAEPRCCNFARKNFIYESTLIWCFKNVQVTHDALCRNACSIQMLLIAKVHLSTSLISSNAVLLEEHLDSKVVNDVSNAHHCCSVNYLASKTVASCTNKSEFIVNILLVKVVCGNSTYTILQ